MADQLETLKEEGGLATTARPLDIGRDRVSRRLFVDRLARRLVTLGGVTIIAAILAILFVIAAQVYPLFKKPTATHVGTASAGGGSDILAVGVDEYREIAYLVRESGVEFFSVADGRIIPSVALNLTGGAKVVGTSTLGRNPSALGLSDGRIIPVQVNFVVSFPGQRRLVEPDLIASDPIVLDPGRRPIKALAYVLGPNGPVAAASVSPKDIAIVSIRERKALVGPSTREESRSVLSLPVEGEVRALVLDGRGEDLFVGASSGQVARVNLRDPKEPKVSEVVLASNQAGVGISVMGFLIGDRTLVVGNDGGGVSSWQLLRERGGEYRLKKTYDFAPHGETVVAFAPSRRDKGFVTADSSGKIHLSYGTTGRTLLTVDSGAETLGAALKDVTFAPKADGFIAAYASGFLSHWALNNPHPEVTLRSLFGKVWYEGYDRPSYVWQSTGATDDFESKFSLTPLIYGTLKGTFYALLFAVPLALLGALYASQFMHPTIKSYVKPTVEIMAALPSVVLGFIAGLWLAPMIERVVPGVFLMLLVISSLILLSLLVWNLVPGVIRKRLRPGTEVFLLIPLVVAGGWLSFYLGGLLESAFLAGDYRGWLRSALGLTYDQRNSLVVGFAMGFAVIPIIFTIAEDSLSNVPAHLTAGSLALGATRWQTAVRVVLPTASPGIFSAVMIGFGRAVGETMIVLMATGNTPVMNWSMFSGFRALSANIAVELPEAPEGGTLYRVLFLAAFLLFVMTFIVNTMAELVRLRLRKRYSLL